MTDLVPLLAQAGRPFPDWSWFTDRNVERIWAALREHVELTVLAVALGLLIAVPLAVAAVRWRPLHTPLLALTGLLFTIPSVALFVLLLAYAGTGLDRTTSLIGLTIYTLLILFRNTVAGLDGVAADVVEAAEAMGFGSPRRLLRVELPLSLPVFMAGVRIAAVTTIGLVTITAFIGQGGLGRFFIGGFQRNNATEVAVGLIGSVVLALGADLLLLRLQRLLTPWSQART